PATFVSQSAALRLPGAVMANLLGCPDAERGLTTKKLSCTPFRRGLHHLVAGKERAGLLVAGRAGQLRIPEITNPPWTPEDLSQSTPGLGKRSLGGQRPRTMA